MTPQQKAVDIARGIEIRKQIAKLEDELKAIETRLEEDALKYPFDHVPLQDKDREGKQYLAEGSDKIIPVIFESDLIAGSFLPESNMHRQVVAVLGEQYSGQLPRLFKDTRAFMRVTKDGKAFRKLAREILDNDTFARLISAVTQRDKAGIPKSRTIIAWDEARPV